MFLEGGTRDHFMRGLSQEYPQMVAGYEQLYARKYAPAAYRKEVQTVVALLRTKYGMAARHRDEDGTTKPEATAEAEQQMLEWR
jgi:hypothetical protein